MVFCFDLDPVGAAELHEKRREPASAGKPPGTPFFWVLFFGGAKKSTSPTGRKKNLNSISPEGEKPEAKKCPARIGETGRKKHLTLQEGTTTSRGPWAWTKLFNGCGLP